MKYFSILTDNFKECYICHTSQNIHLHHVFFGSNKKMSTEHGMIVPLCIYHHTGSNEAVHLNAKLNMRLKVEFQARFEEMYSRDKFLKIFGKSYL